MCWDHNSRSVLPCDAWTLDVRRRVHPLHRDPKTPVLFDRAAHPADDRGHAGPTGHDRDTRSSYVDTAHALEMSGNRVDGRFHEVHVHRGRNGRGRVVSDGCAEHTRTRLPSQMEDSRRWPAYHSSDDDLGLLTRRRHRMTDGALRDTDDWSRPVDQARLRRATGYSHDVAHTGGGGGRGVGTTDVDMSVECLELPRKRRTL